MNIPVNMQESTKDTVKYIIYEDVMIEVRDTLLEYIDHIEIESEDLDSHHTDKIRRVLHNFESGLCLMDASGVT